MFIIDVIYKKSLEEIEDHLMSHREFLDQGYQQHFFIASGPKVPRTGGIIISQLTNREQLEKILAEDPFRIHDVADYNITEFTPNKYHPHFSIYIEGK